jgi:hypothetical protein
MMREVDHFNREECAEEVESTFISFLLFHSLIEWVDRAT